MRDFDWLIIDTLKRTGNVTRAAKLLFITQPTLTRRVQLIEEELGFALLVRSSKGIVMTPAGEYVAEQAAKILAIIAQMRLGIAAFSNGEMGTLHVGAPTAYAMYVMPAFIARFAARYPDVNLDMMIEHSGEILRLLESRELDVGFARGEVKSAALEKRLISEDQVCIVAAAPFTLEQLRTMPRIDFVREGSVVRRAEQWWKEHFDTPPVVRMRLNSCQQCLAMVRQNLGYGIISDRKFFQRDKDLFVYPLSFQNGEPFISKTWIVWHRDNAYNPILQNFLRFAEEVDINNLD